MRYSSRENTSSIALATLLTIGRFRLVETPVKALGSTQLVRDHSTSSERNTQLHTENNTDSIKEYVLHLLKITLFILSIGTPSLLTILILNFEIVILIFVDVSKILLFVWQTVLTLIRQMQCYAMSDLGLHCLQRLICPNT